MKKYEKDFSEFEIKNLSVRFEGEETSTKLGCVGSYEESLNTKTVRKKCEGIVVKQVTRGDGTGELKVNIHMRYDLFTKCFGMDFEGLKNGVHSYGRNSVHKSFCLTGEVYDEDGNEKLKAYPNVVINSGVARKIENGAEEVAEMELTIGVMPDETGQGMYEAIVSTIEDEEVKSKWMTSFSPDLVKMEVA